MSINVELFSCAGGMAEGFHRAGVAFDMAFDADPNACESYATNIGLRPIQMDVRDLLRMVIAGWSPGPVDLILADPPCTPWSRAGKRLGTADERDMLKDTCELVEWLHPTAWFIANVPGLDDSNHWESVVQPVIGGMASRSGYCVDYVRLDSADFGVAQHRIRLFWFGHQKGSPCIRWPDPTHGDASTLRLDGRLPWVTCREALGHLPIEKLGRPVRVRNKPSQHPCSQTDVPGNTVPASRPGNGGAILLLNDKHPPNKLDDPAMTVCAKDYGGAQGARVLILREPDPNRPPASLDEPHRSITGVRDQALLEWPWDRPSTTVFAQTAQTGGPGNGSPGNRPNAVVLSEKAAAILQGFPDGWVFAGKTKKARWSQIGQAMPAPLAEAVARSYVAWRERRRIFDDAPLLNAGGRA